MNGRRPAVLACAFACGLALAPAVLAQESDRLRAELQRLQRDAQQRTEDVERLLEARIRHDLGLPADPSFAPAAASEPAGAGTTEALDRARAELQREDAAAAVLLSRARKLEAELEKAKAAAEAEAERRRREEEWIAVPAPGTRPEGLDGGRQHAGQSESGDGRTGAGDGEPAADAGQEPAAAPLRVVPNLEPVRARIHGTNDHARVAAALFRAAQALADQAGELRRQGHGGAATQADALAQEKLVRALAELEPLLAEPRPPFAALFLQGRCRELAFRIDERAGAMSLRKDQKEFQRREQEVREPFLQIAARDVTKQGERKTIEVLGEWGRAAQTALEHFRWLNVHAGYQPKAPLESIRWDGEAK